MKYFKMGLFVAIIAIAFVLPPRVAAFGPVVTITATSSQPAPQGTLATYSVDVAWGFPSVSFSLTLAGLPSGAAYSFSPNPTTTDVTLHASSTLTIDTGSLPLYCPGSYSFKVTATSGPNVGTSTPTALTVAMVGSPLLVSVSTDKPTYRVGDTISIFVTLTRPAEGTLQITGPSGFSAITYPFATTGPVSGVAKKLTAGAIGTYTVSLAADDYCGGFGSAQASFAVNPNTYDVTISLSGVPSQYSSTLQVDGQQQGTVQGSQPKTLSFPIGSSHTIMVDQYVAGEAGVRYYSSQNSWSVSSADSHTFNYQTQYQFSVLTDPNGVTPTTGAGWYNEGASVQTNQVPQTVQGPSGTQYVFKNWELDGAAQSGSQVSVTMDKPHTAVAKYATQYQLVIDSGGIGNPQGAGYYDAGTSATFSVASPVGFLVQQVFVRWEGDYTGTSPQGSVTMDKPKTVHAVWTTSYTQAYIAAGVLVVAIIAAAILMMRRGKGGTKAKPSKGKRIGLRIGKPKTET
ncbi:MAG: hypothetical protein ABSC50_02695 [Candidatus Bathyarchaeia archaeon]